MNRVLRFADAISFYQKSGTFGLSVYFSTTTTDKIFEKNSSFHVKWRTTRKVQFLFSRSLLLKLTIFFLAGRLGTRL